MVVHISVKIVRSSFLGVISEVEHVQGIALSLIGVAVGIDFTHIHFADIVIGELVKVALDVARGE